MAQAAVLAYDDRGRFIAQQACTSLGIETDAFEEAVQDPATLELLSSFLNGGGPQSLLVFFGPVAKEETPAEPSAEESAHEEPEPPEPPPVEVVPEPAPAAEPAPETKAEDGEAPKVTENAVSVLSARCYRHSEFDFLHFFQLSGC